MDAETTGRGEWLRQIRHRLQYGLPPLTLDEERQLYEYATGDRIERRKRCHACEGEGVQTEYAWYATYFVDCPDCQGKGYTVTDAS